MEAGPAGQKDTGPRAWTAACSESMRCGCPVRIVDRSRTGCTAERHERKQGAADRDFRRCGRPAPQEAFFFMRLHMLDPTLGDKSHWETAPTPPLPSYIGIEPQGAIAHSLLRGLAGLRI